MILVSACLAGIECRYNGGSFENKAVMELVRQGKAIPFCPELLGGLPVPRPSCEIITDPQKGLRVVSQNGCDYTAEFRKGAKKALAMAKALNCKKAILKSRSPSCGCGLVYDGTFSGRLVGGNGLTAELLTQHGVHVYTEDDFFKPDEA